MFSLNFLLVSCLLALVCHTVQVTAAVGDKRVANGIPITIDKAPYTVQLKNVRGYLFCGGTLVTEQIVITASHCFDAQKPEETTVVAGATKRHDEDGHERSISKVIKHPKYHADTFHSDVAIVFLDKPFELSDQIRTVPLCQQAVPEGDDIQTSGWGKTENVDNSEDLMTVRIPVGPWERCARYFGRTSMTNMICASGYEAKGSCVGDSGGPAIYRGQLCGIVAFGKTCGKVGHPVAYTDVYGVRSFIETAMKQS